MDLQYTRVPETRIAFYSPLKPAGHPIPSGDGLMGGLLIDCLTRAGYKVDIASQLRVFLKDPNDEAYKYIQMDQANLEIQRLNKVWKQHGAPRLWFCYHSYYKSPDLIGPELCDAFDIPYITAEASYSNRRNQGVWGPMQKRVLSSINRAAVNICFTERDRVGLHKASPGAKLEKLRPFIDSAEFGQHPKCPEPYHLVTVAMMRSGDKMNSYIRLAASLKMLMHLPWTLSIIGDGPLREEVHNLFNDFPVDRIVWHGQQDRAGIAAIFARSALYVWPGCGEAYGLAYLEAQAAGLPVIAFETAGVPEVVDNGYSGILTPVGDDTAYAQAISSLLGNNQLYSNMADNAALHVQHKHTNVQASKRLHAIVQGCIGPYT